MHSIAQKNTTIDNIYTIVSAIKPFDKLEEQHIEETLAWIKSGDPIFRIKKPDIPNKHLVSYFVLFDEAASKILLVDHKKAQLWLPTGGHVEINEDPKITTQRECLEELGVHAHFWCEDPIFVTSTETVGLTAGHTDVSLWYVLKGSQNSHYTFEEREFNSIKWFSFDNIPYDNSDPHLKRFIEKFKLRIAK
ncbi:MAG: NUDIX hydrolase [Alphaproteobacteria bacterium CG_4_10_14_0_8_um_filter_37_21]|nr:MAG: NUDIX hydrolase [Alphaproteobacteria bacterium CG_4_10_14_0_8_um_filter_37_21]